jgi:hypothetical protein
MTGGQLLELVRLRWRMVRSERVRLGLVLLAALIPGLLCAAVIAGQLVPRGRSFDVTVLAPTAFLGFAVLSLVAPLAAGGGNELFPPEQLTPYPIRPSTEFAASLLVAPLNLAWMTQALLLFGITSFVTGDRPGLGLALVTTLVYVALVTVAGQGVAWLVIGARQTAAGRRWVWAAAGAVAVATVVVVRADLGYAVLDHSPTTPVVDSALAGASQHLGRWLAGTTQLAGLLAIAYIGGARACAWALRRPGDGQRFRESRTHRRRRPAAGAGGALARADRASVWRSAPLRRGLLVLTLLPGLVAAGAGLEWESLAVVPALVTAGAGLLFGVNVFCLDGGGATWLASLPHPPRQAIAAKTLVLAETITGSGLIAAVAGSLRAEHPPTAADIAALLGCVVSCSAVVLATCVHVSLAHPRHALLRGGRDTPAPPAAMAVYSARLATVTTLIGLLFGGVAHAGSWSVAVVLAVAMTTLSGVSLARSVRSWDDPVKRAQVVAAVSSG